MIARMELRNPLHGLAAFGRTLKLRMTLRSRDAIRRHHERGCARLVADARADIDFYRKLGPEFADMPIIDKAVQQGRFAAFNQPRIELEEVVAALADGRQTVRGYFVGQSTGTSGNRGRYVISPAERFTWLGTILAKAAPDALYRRRRVALALPGLSALYQSASSGSRIRLAFFDLGLGVESWRNALVDFAPDLLVAPPKVLRRLAETGALRGVEPFSGAEILDPLDRAVIEQATGRPVREIYMATEGLFGVACRHGTLHLAEDVIHFEWEPVPGSGLVAPIVTDLVRRTQPMIRYRMNDLLELSDRQCPCGSVFQAVSRIHGRIDDLFEFPGPGGQVMITPDVLRNAVVDADPRILDFRVVQKLDGRVVVTLAAELAEDAAQAAAASVERALARAGAHAIIETERGIEPRFDRKLRRVERERAGKPA
jgi:putative adenylate-forming enzyme